MSNGTNSSKEATTKAAEAAIAAVDRAFRELRGNLDIRVAEVRMISAAAGAEEARGKHRGWRPPAARIQLEVRARGCAPRLASIDVFRTASGDGWQTPTVMTINGQAALIAQSVFDDLGLG